MITIKTKELDSVMPMKVKADVVRSLLDDLEKDSEIIAKRVAALEKKARKIEAKYKSFKDVLDVPDISA